MIQDHPKNTGSFSKGNSFFLEGKGRRAVLLIHGFTASTQEMEGLGKTLASNGFTVSAPLLAGHNATFDEFKRTKADDYFASVLDAYDRLKGYETIDVVGLSFGAVLALRLATCRPVRKIVALAPAIFLKRGYAFFVPLIAKLYRGAALKRIKFTSATGAANRWDILDPEGMKKRIAYPWLAFPQLRSTIRLIQEVKEELGRIANPILIIQSKLDGTVSPCGARFLFDKIGSKDKTLDWLEKSGHIITDDYEREKVKKSVVDFLNI
jgi:carboxylesterase